LRQTGAARRRALAAARSMRPAGIELRCVLSRSRVRPRLQDGQRFVWVAARVRAAGVTGRAPKPAPSNAAQHPINGKEGRRCCARSCTARRAAQVGGPGSHPLEWGMQPWRIASCEKATGQVPQRAPRSRGQTSARGCSGRSRERSFRTAGDNASSCWSVEPDAVASPSPMESCAPSSSSAEPALQRPRLLRYPRRGIRLRAARSSFLLVQGSRRRIDADERVLGDGHSQVARVLR
jgi:hypothetical protein